MKITNKQVQSVATLWQLNWKGETTRLYFSQDCGKSSSNTPTVLKCEIAGIVLYFDCCNYDKAGTVV